MVLKTCPKFVRKLLKFIHHKMLVVEAKDRAQIGEVCREIERIMPQHLPTFHNIEVLFKMIEVDEEGQARQRQC